MSRSLHYFALAVVVFLLCTLQLASNSYPDGVAGRGKAMGGPRDEEASYVPASYQGPDGSWIYLSDLPWSQASTGWVAIADDSLPARDGSFGGGPLTIAGTFYDKGLGVYPRSEIRYALNGNYAAFESDIGLNDMPRNGEEDRPSAAIFKVYLDDALAYESGPVRRGESPAPISLPIAGVQELRLAVASVGPPSSASLADWANARLLQPVEPISEEEVEAVLAPLKQQVANRRLAQADEQQRLGALDAETLAFVPQIEVSRQSSTLPVVVSDPSRSAVVLWNGLLAVSYGLGGEGHGQLTVLDAASGHVVLYRGDASVAVAPNLRLSFHLDTVPSSGKSWVASDVHDPVFGTGKRLDLFLRSRDGRFDLVLTLVLYEGSTYFTQQIAVIRSPAPLTNSRIGHIDGSGSSNLAVGSDLRYLTDVTRVRGGSVPDDGIERWEPVDEGKALFVASEVTGRGLLIAPLDETETPADAVLKVDPGRVMAQLGFETGPARKAGSSDVLLRGPRLYLEVTSSAQPALAFRNFRRFAAQLYPALPLPDWVRYQWLSWYVYGMDVDESRIRRQIDYIADNLGDLGPWHIILDAGWYIAEGRADAGLRKVDLAKFPSGLPVLVEYAHSKNVRVVLYFTAPYLNAGTRAGDWLGLRGIIDNHRDWLIHVGGDEANGSFIYDLNNPQLRAYLSDVLRDFFLTYDVDGIKVDGLGNAQGATLASGERDAFGLATRLRSATMEIYRLVRDQAFALKEDAYIESGWQTPLFANSLAHTFRYGDEDMAFSSRYPFPGLVEHVDYAIAQQTLWGQRPNIGAVYADPRNGNINEQWLQAALALGAQVSLSFDLPLLSPELLSRYRGLLANYRPFAGNTHYGNVAGVDSFATAVGDVTYLAVLNRSTEPRAVDLPLADYGLESGVAYAVYDMSAESFSRAAGNLSVAVEPNSLRLFVLRGTPGVLWTNSSFALDDPEPGRLALAVRGPRQVRGFVRLYAPDLKSLWLDGRLLNSRLGVLNGFTYDATTGIATVRYRHDQPHRLELSFTAAPLLP